MKLALLKNNNFFLLIQGKLVSMFGSFMMTFAMSLYVLENYESTTMFASVLIMGIVPSILFAPIAGVFVDRLDRRLTLVVLDVLCGIAVLITTILFFMTGGLSVIAIYVVTIVLATANTIYGPAIASTIPLLFEKDQLFEANTIDRLVFMIANIGGPLTAGILMSVSHLGTIMLINGLSYLFSAFTEMFIKLPTITHEKTPLSFKNVYNDFRSGLKFFKNNKVLLHFLVILMIINFATGPLSTIIVPYYLKKTLEIPDAVYGGFNAVVVIAMILSMLLTEPIRKRYTLEKIIRYDFILMAIIVALFVITTTTTYLSQFNHYIIPMLVALLLMCIVMMFDTIGGIAIDTALHQMIPKELFGRIMTIFVTGVRLAVPIGQSLVGVGIDALSLWIPVSLCALVIIVGTLLIHVYVKDNTLVPLSSKEDSESMKSQVEPNEPCSPLS